MQYDLIVIGSGAAGMTAAVRAKEAGISRICRTPFTAFIRHPRGAKNKLLASCFRRSRHGCEKALRARRRRVPTGDPRKTLYIHCKQRSPSLKIDFQAGASCIFVGSILLPAPAENGAKRIFQRLSDLLFQMIKFIRVEKLCKRDT